MRYWPPNGRAAAAAAAPNVAPHYQELDGGREGRAGRTHCYATGSPAPTSSNWWRDDLKWRPIICRALRVVCLPARGSAPIWPSTISRPDGVWVSERASRLAPPNRVINWTTRRAARDSSAAGPGAPKRIRRAIASGPFAKYQFKWAARLMGRSVSIRASAGKASVFVGRKTGAERAPKGAGPELQLARR